MKTALQTKLASLVPSIDIQTHWRLDDFCGSIHDEVEGMESERAEDWQAWASEVRVSLIHKGEIKTFSDYLGGTWERIWDNPWESNPDISGYESDMTVNALSQARDFCFDLKETALLEQIETAIASL